MISLVEWGKIIVLHVLHNVACLSSLILTRDKGMYGMYRMHRLYGTRKAGYNQTDHRYRAGSLWRDAVVISAANSQIRRSSSSGRMGLVERTTTSRWEATYLEKPLSHFWIVSRFPGTTQSSKYSTPGRHVNVWHVHLSNSDLHCSTIQVL